MSDEIGGIEIVEPSSKVLAPMVVGDTGTWTSAEPEPLRRPVPPAHPYPIAALDTLLAAAAQRIHEVVKAPDALCGQSILAAASLAVQALADVCVDGRREPLSLACISIAESGERKTGVDRIALRAHKQHEHAMLEQYRVDKTVFDVALDANKAARRALAKGDDAEAIEAAMNDFGPPPEAPLMPLLLVGAPTLEGLHLLLKFGLPSVGLFHDDAGEFFGGHAMNRDNRVKSAAGLSKLWDYGEFDRVRASDGAEKFFGRRLAMHLMMQPVVADTVLGDEQLTGQGFLARCLLAWPWSTIGRREYCEVDPFVDDAVIRYERRVTELLQLPLPLRAGTRNELEPRALPLSPAAKQRWITIHNAIEKRMQDGKDFASIRPWASKAPAQVLRIAGVLSVFANPDVAAIDVDAVDRAATLLLFALGEAVRVVGTCSVPVEIRHAELLRDWCYAQGIRLLNSKAALQFGPAAIRNKHAFDAAIEQLVRAGWATVLPKSAMPDGIRYRRAWMLRPPLDPQ
jgi:hypothetical protein